MITIIIVIMTIIIIMIITVMLYIYIYIYNLDEPPDLRGTEIHMFTPARTPAASHCLSAPSPPTKSFPIKSP